MTIKIIYPATGEPLEKTGEDAFVTPSGKTISPKDGIYLFAEDTNYTDSFGFQWNKFEKTQIDREASHSHQSGDRFKAVTLWHNQDLRGKSILEVGSGAGRFTREVLNQTQAYLYSVDYSSAVFANYRNNGANERLKLFQASIYQLPFAPRQFDKVFCFGVLQHTPDFKKSVQCLADMVRPGGELIVDFYSIRGWYTKIHAKYLLRPFTKNMKHERLLKLIDANADWMIAFTQAMNRLGIGKFVNRFVPICDIAHTLPANLTPQQLREWVVLDTFDMFSPQYDNPQTIETVKQWVAEAGLTVTYAGFVKYGAENFEAAVVKAQRPL
jgi:SAM-dependent methyltransferase